MALRDGHAISCPDTHVNVNAAVHNGADRGPPRRADGTFAPGTKVIVSLNGGVHVHAEAGDTGHIVGRAA